MKGSLWLEKKTGKVHINLTRRGVSGNGYQEYVLRTWLRLKDRPGGNDERQNRGGGNDNQDTLQKTRLSMDGRRFNLTRRRTKEIRTVQARKPTPTTCEQGHHPRRHLKAKSWKNHRKNYPRRPEITTRGNRTLKLNRDRKRCFKKNANSRSRNRRGPRV